MGEEFTKAVAQTLVRQEKRIAMLENIISYLLHHLSEEKGVFTEDEVDQMFDSAQQLTDLDSKERLDQVCEAFGLPLTN